MDFWISANNKNMTYSKLLFLETSLIVIDDDRNAIRYVQTTEALQPKGNTSFPLGFFEKQNPDINSKK